MMVRLLVPLFIFSFFILIIRPVFAESSYVLPYPSSMPGSKFYKVSLIWDEIRRYWYFGDFGQFKYNLGESDKYLVEAKTLFEYKQYLLGYKSLQKSDFYFLNILPFLKKAQKENKNISAKVDLFREASRKHIEVLVKMKMEVPETFNWQPEKSQSTNLNLKKAIVISIKMRKNSI